MVWLSFTEQRKKFVTDHGYAFLGFLSVESAELGVEGGDYDIDDSVCLHKRT